jgi:hypothetical protein
MLTITGVEYGLSSGYVAWQFSYLPLYNITKKRAYVV